MSEFLYDGNLEGDWLTSGPDLVHVCAALLPAVEISLHVLIEILPSRFYHLIVVDDIVPIALVLVVFIPGATDDDTPVFSRNEVVELPFSPSQSVCLCQPFYRTSRYYPATNAAHRDDLARVYRKNSRRICIASVDHMVCLYRAPWCSDRPSARIVSLGGDGLSWSVCVEVCSLINATAKKM